ncbi:hypothetical protein ES319_D06G168500v1 [Gossypium barbadense]|uniref:Uncharacterized protein n=1 Tax=Gossypium barbadense TaxID=3634 RepID=A0A5J5R499_GOSBA|nr:hypothetical protein ES319_D06G168500v1 [Gossypium barbadense]KAB2025699.1 hypothetical protein ES319_D06G168500v1 [Gossypium barbadense]KAB2025700.1 hypothetical protein ES319_D06G168500v1 [Gossypium barbadense]KAB2025701.1 hypothetical protein ES319_D06G168500v1 [Gossypium barbadense]
MSFLAMDLKLALQIMQQLEMDAEYEGNVGGMHLPWFLRCGDGLLFFHASCNI